MNTAATLRTHRPGKKILLRALLCSLFLILPSCGIPGQRQPDPPPPMPETFRGSTNPENAALVSIESFFNDTMLTTLIEQALLNNRELKILEEEVQVARAEILARQGAYLPFLSFGASAGIDKPSEFTPLGQAERQLEYLPGKHFPDPLPNYQLGLNFLWQLDIWREYRNARDAANQRYLAAIDRRNFFVTRLVAECGENYFRLMALDKRLETLDQTIALQEQSLKVAEANKIAARGTEVAVQRFQAEVRKNQSEKLIVAQEIIEVQNRLNFLVNRFPQPVERLSAGFFELSLNALSLGLPSQLLQNRPDIRQAERELEAAGLDVRVARAHFFPKVSITAGVGYQAFNPKYLFWTPEALVYNAAGNLIQPLINKKAIQAEYLAANAKQLEAVYNYQRVVLNAFTEVVNHATMVDNYTKSIDIKKQQLDSLVASVDAATKLFQNARAEYLEVLLAQRDLMEARMVLIETKNKQLAAIVNTYQALGGGLVLRGEAPPAPPAPAPAVVLPPAFPPAPVPVPPPPAPPAPAAVK